MAIDMHRGYIFTQSVSQLNVGINILHDVSVIMCLNVKNKTSIKALHALCTNSTRVLWKWCPCTTINSIVNGICLCIYQADTQPTALASSK